MQEHIKALIGRLPLCNWRDYPQTAPIFQQEFDATGKTLHIRHHFNDDPDTHTVGFAVDLLDGSDVFQITDRLIHLPGLTFEAVGYDFAADVVVCRVAGRDPDLAF